MKRSYACYLSLALAVFASSLQTAHAVSLTPGEYEYTIKMKMAGIPANMPAQTLKRCLTPKDVEGQKSFVAPASNGSDCQVKDMKESGGQFSYSMSCTKPQKLDGTVKGNATATSISMDMTFTTPNVPGPMNQSIAAKRVGDCK